MVGLQSQQLHAQQRAATKIEGPMHRFERTSRGFLFTIRDRDIAQVDLSELDVRMGLDDAARAAVHRHEARAQALLPRDDHVQRCLQRRYVQRATKAQDCRNVVHGAVRLHLLHEPQAPLIV